MNVTIKYHLNSEGQKASILAGGDGKDVQTIAVKRDDPEFTRALGAAEINSDGTATIVACGWNGKLLPTSKSWDHTPTATEILDDLATRKAAYTAEQDAEAAERRDAALKVLAERKTSKRNTYVCVEGIPSSVYYNILSPDWPYDSPEDVKESPEAVAWMAELDTENEQRKSEAIDDARAKQAAEEAARQAKREAETARRARLELEDGDTDWEIQDGALAEVPKWESHKRGKNWMARIEANARAPGGLEREFAERAKGDLYYILPALSAGDAIEFGSDYYSGSGRKSADRWYGYVVRFRPADDEFPAMLILHQCSTGKAAVTAGEKHRKTMTVSTA